MCAKRLSQLHLSPSEYHRHIMDDVQPALSYAGGDVGKWQSRVRRKVGALLGYAPPKPVALNARTLWKRDHALGTIEKVAFTAEPYADVVAYVCLPKRVQPPYPFMISLQGHSTGMHVSIGVDREDESKRAPVQGDRDFGLGCMKRGIAALCIEQRAFGEREENCLKKKAPGNRCHDAAMHALMLGKTLAGERVLDVARGVDYLAARGDADMKRIGVMGNSGGGTVTIFASALIPRIAYAMPSCSFCTYRDSIMSVYHCADNYVPGLYLQADMGDVLGLFAPRPVVVVAGRTDPIFPVEGVRRAFANLKRIYAAAGAEDRCHLVIGGAGHRFYASRAWPIMKGEIERLKAR